MRVISKSIMALLFSLVMTSMIFAAEPADPEPQEAADFAAILARLEANEASMPTNVDDAIVSLSSEVVKRIPCPPKTDVDSVVVKITTRHIKFDRSLTIADSALSLDPNRNGYYVWSGGGVVKNGIKTYTKENYIMLDPAFMRQGETNGTLGEYVNEGLLYHELLHGELLIDAMEADTGWARVVCNCTFDMSSSDADSHLVIPGKVESYWTGRTGGTTNVVTVAPPSTIADDSCKFSVVVACLADFEKKFADMSFFPYLPEDNNIDESSIEITQSEGNIVVSGKLVDCDNPGFFILEIDPPADVMYVGHEENIMVYPATSGIPAMPVWGLFLMIALLLAVAIMYLKRQMA